MGTGAKTTSSFYQMRPAREMNPGCRTLRPQMMFLKDESRLPITKRGQRPRVERVQDAQPYASGRVLSVGQFRADIAQHDNRFRADRMLLASLCHV
jgi:hypothetical protein